MKKSWKFVKGEKIHFKRKTMERVAAIAVVFTLLMTGTIVSQAAKSVSQLTSEKEKLQQEIKALDSELVGVLSSINELEADIAETNQDIKDAQQDMADAQKAADKKYDDMKVRMKYMYEKGDDSVVTIFLESGTISEFVNRVEYANTVYTYDREQLETYQSLVEEIKSMKANLEREKTNLQSQQNRLAAQKKSLDSMIATKKTQVKDFDQQLAKAKQVAAQQAAASRAAGQTATQKSNSSSVSGGGKNPSGATGTGGGAVVSYACQFVGNPYVWGGNSLTEGCDCSGFVHLVLQHFGISSPRQSDAFLSGGQEVSYECMQAGDVVVYPNHVAIYDGAGMIVEAKNSRCGITHDRPVNCKTILGIRRYV